MQFRAAYIQVEETSIKSLLDTTEIRSKGTPHRRHDIDWLRVIAFIFLIFYHIGMYYVADWQWHVKSPHQSVLLQSVMLIVNPWRMSLIFLVSGIALSLVEPKISWLQLLKIRFIRVFIPLLLGMYIIVPPQLYLELVSKEELTYGYFSFLSFYINTDTEMYPHHQHGNLGLLTWNHLWYLAYLCCYTLIYISLKPLLIRVDWKSSPGKRSPTLLFLTPVALLILYKTLLAPHFPQTYALAGDWYSHALYATMFFFGYALAKIKDAWNTIISYRRVWTTMAVTHYVLLLVLVHDSVKNWLGEGNLGEDLSVEFIHDNLAMPWIVSAYMISSLFTVIAYAGSYMNKPSKILHYMNEAILPWYILHQTIIILLTVALSFLTLGPIIEALVMIVLTFCICAALYELIKRFIITRFIFGMKLTHSPQQHTLN